MTHAAGPAAVGPSIVRRLRRHCRGIHLVLAAMLAVCVVSAAVFLAVYQPRAVRIDKAMVALHQAGSAVQDERSVVLGRLLEPGSSGPGVAVDQATLERADASVLRSGLDGRQVLDELVGVTSAEQAWETEWVGPALQIASSGGSASAAFLRQGHTLYLTYESASNRAVSDLRAQYNQAVADERTVVLLALIVEAALIALVVALLVLARRRISKMTKDGIETVLESVKRIESGEVVDIRSLGPPLEFGELANVAVGAALELDSLRGAVGVSTTRGEDRARKLGEVLELTKTITGHLSLSAVLTALSRAVRDVSGASRVVVWISDDDGIRAEADSDAGRMDDDSAPPLDTGQPSEAVANAAGYGRTVKSGEGRHEQLVVPMTAGGRVLGVVELRGHGMARMAEEDVALVETLASHGASAVGVARVHGATESMSLTDSLTHLPNRRQLDHDLGTECERARRYRRSSALIMIDIDGFKTFNDRHGHLAADQILAEFGKLLADAIRGSDSAYRYGGDEFVVLVREASLDAAADLAERLRNLVAERFSVLPPDAPVTASFGVVGVDQVDPEPATLLRAADEALYSAKERGRNRVVAFR